MANQDQLVTRGSNCDVTCFTHVSHVALCTALHRMVVQFVVLHCTGLHCAWVGLCVAAKLGGRMLHVA